MLGLEARSLWLDEATSLSIAAQSFGNIISGTGFDRHTPPFYYLLLHLWLSPLDDNIWNLRLFSVFFDIINVALLFTVVRKLLDSRTALLAGVIWAVSPYTVYYAQEGRMYSLLVTLVLICTLFALKVRDGRFSALDSLLLAVSAAAGLYTHYYFALAFAALSLAVLPEYRRHRADVLRWLAACVVAGIAFIPWIGVVIQLAGSGGQSFRTFTFAVLPYTLFRFAAGYGVFAFQFDTKDDFLASAAQHGLEITVYCVAFAAAAAYGLYLILKVDRTAAKYILLPLLFPAAAALLISLKVPMLSERYLIVSFPFFVTCLSAALAGPMRGKLRLPATAVVELLLVAGLLMHYFNPAFGNTEWDSAAEVVKQTGPETYAVVNPDYAVDVLAYYLGKKQTLTSTDSLPGVETFWLVERGTSTSELNNYLQQGWELQQEVFLPKENGIRMFLLRKPMPRAPDAG